LTTEREKERREREKKEKWVFALVASAQTSA